ncbi:type 11 methyltransferase [Calothrix sp. NIES-4071]|nr:type 11 methyltransferase [Calothrix sp. NIES-4071]BAZ56067.1 type 11 methyltransferase [Calothrix sp. NIES-4105]
MGGGFAEPNIKLKQYIDLTNHEEHKGHKGRKEKSYSKIMEKSKDLIKDYPSFDGLTEESLEDNSSLKKTLHFVGKNKRVVDFGCATGYLAQLLKLNGCVVTGVDYNQEAAQEAERYCQEVIVADLDFTSVTEIFPNQKFDVAIFGDVLEHLRNPWKVLEDTKNILEPDGYIVASIPNIAHGAIRLALLQGKFEYTQFGILDNTHLRFFTKKTIEDLFETTGYSIKAIDRTKLDIFTDVHLVPSFNRDDFHQEVITQIEQDDEADTLQFVIQAFPSAIEDKYIALKAEYTYLKEQYSQLVEQATYLESQLKHTQSELTLTNLKLQEFQQAQIETQLEQAKYQVKIETLQSQIQQKESNVQELEYMIVAMQTSKFWLVREQWLKVKDFWQRIQRM